MWNCLSLNTCNNNQLSAGHLNTCQNVMRQTTKSLSNTNIYLLLYFPPPPSCVLWISYSAGFIKFIQHMIFSEWATDVLCLKLKITQKMIKFSKLFSPLLWQSNQTGDRLCWGGSLQFATVWTQELICIGCACTCVCVPCLEMLANVRLRITYRVGKERASLRIQCQK